MIRALTLAALALTVAGCAKTVYRHPAYTPDLWNKDRYECERDVRQSGHFGTGINAMIAMQDFFDSCLAARGWTKTRQ